MQKTLKHTHTLTQHIQHKCMTNKMQLHQRQAHVYNKHTAIPYTHKHTKHTNEYRKSWSTFICEKSHTKQENYLVNSVFYNFKTAAA